MYETSVKTTAAALLALVMIAPAVARAHSAKQLDQNGCHDDRRRGQYHCHLGEYRGLKFSSEGDFHQQVKAGKTAAQMRQEQGVDQAGESTDEVDEGWLSGLHIPFIGRSDSGARDVGGGNVIMPRGIEERLRTLKDLHEKGLIADDEYDAKRKEILGEL
jgi:hypothetical protein